MNLPSEIELHIISYLDDVMLIMFKITSSEYNNLISVNFSQFDSKNIIKRDCSLLRPVAKAALYGYLDIISYYVNDYSNQWDKDIDYQASIGGHMNIIKYIHEYRPNNNLCISTVAQEGHMEALEYLYDNGYDYNLFPYIYGDVAANGHLDILKFLHNKGLRIDNTDNVCGDNKILDKACMNKQLECVKFLISIGFKSGDETLKCAIKSGCLKTVEYIYDTNRTFIKGEYLCEAAYGGHLDILRYFYNLDLPSEYWSGDVIANACIKGHLDTIKFLDSVNCTKDAKCLSEAALNSHYECVKYMLENHYQYDAEDLYTSTVSGEDESITILKLLFSYNIPCSSIVYESAAQHNNLEIIKFLYSKNILIDKFSIQIAIEHDAFECFKYLFDITNCDINDVCAFIYDIIFQDGDNMLEYIYSKFNLNDMSEPNLDSNLIYISVKDHAYKCLKLFHQKGTPYDKDILKQKMRGKEDCTDYINDYML